MESASERGGYDQVPAELARVRDALDDLRRRPLPLDADTLRHVITASLSEASAPPPNLLVTAIRRLDRVDARLESIEAALAGPGALPRGGSGGAGPGRGQAQALPAAPAVSYTAPPPDAEAIAEALARRLAGSLPAPTPLSGGGGATTGDLLGALRPRVPDAARAVLRRAGREPSPQAVEVLQQTAMIALEEAVDALGSLAPSVSAFAAPALRPAPPPPPALQPPAPLPAPPPPAPTPLDVEALAATVAAEVVRAVGELRPVPAEAPVGRPPEPAEPPPPPIDPEAVAEAVISSLARQPPPQAVVSPVAMAPLLSAVGRVEAAVARLAEPEADVVVAVDRLEAGVDALARALEEDRSAQAEEVRRGFVQVTELLGAEPGSSPRVTGGGGERALGGEEAGASPRAPDQVAALIGVQRRLDDLASRLAPLTDVGLATTVPTLAVQGHRLERALDHVLSALAAIAENLHELAATWSTGLALLTAQVGPGGVGEADAGPLSPGGVDGAGGAGAAETVASGEAAVVEPDSVTASTADGFATWSSRSRPSRRRQARRGKRRR